MTVLKHQPSIEEVRDTRSDATDGFDAVLLPPWAVGVIESNAGTVLRRIAAGVNPTVAVFQGLAVVFHIGAMAELNQWDTDLRAVSPHESQAPERQW